MDDRQDLEKLRYLLFGRELLLLYHLGKNSGELEKFNDPKTRAASVSAVLAEALALRGQNDERLNAALEPIIDGVVKHSLRTKISEFSNAIFPLMGPAIRSSVAESFRNMMGSFNKSLELSFSLRGLRWRVEALRSGKSFSEVVLLHTLIYRVEEIYFIHSATGINLLHLVAKGVQAQDADMVSAMLTAVQDFVKDCLVRGQAGGEMESLRLGDYTFLLEKQQTAYLGCLIRGVPPTDFRRNMAICIEGLVVDYAGELADFEGDTTPFAACRPRLEGLFSVRYADDEKPVSPQAKVVLVLLGALLLGLLCWEGFGIWRERKLTAAVELLRREPGLMVVHVNQHRIDPWEVTCLKDDFAESPQAVLKAHAYDLGDFRFKSATVVSSTPELMLRRATAVLNPPETVEMNFEGDTLRLSGTAPMDWILDARRRAASLPGVRNVDSRELDDPRMARLSKLTRRVEETVVEFPSGQDAPLPQDMAKLILAVDALVEIDKLAADMGMLVDLTIYGHADATGSDRRNYEISQNRAKLIAAMLYAKGSSLPVLAYGMGSNHAGQVKGKDDHTSRRVEMRVRLSRNGQVYADVLK